MFENKIVLQRLRFLSLIALVMFVAFAIPTRTYAATKKYTVKFVDGVTNKQISSVKVASGKAATAPTPPKHKHYNFKEWDKSFKKVTKNLTVTAKYSKKKYTVTFVDSISKKTIKTEKVKYQGSATAPTPPKHKGYWFKKWTKDFSKITGDLTVKTKYCPNWTVTFYNDLTGKVIETQSVANGKNAHQPDGMNYRIQYKGRYYNFSGYDISLKNITDDTDIYVLYDKELSEAEVWAEIYKCTNGGTKRPSMTAINNTSGYQYLQSDAERRAYNAIKTHYLNGSASNPYEWDPEGKYAVTTICLDNGVDGKAASRVREALNLDLFEVDISDWNFSYSNYQDNANARENIRKLAQKILSDNGSIASQIKPKYMTEKIASSIFVNYIVNKINYDNSNYAKAVKGWLAWNSGKGNCQAYSKLYKAMCNSIGIQCELVEGYVDGDLDKGHMWNRVNLDGKWYWTDVTWADGDGTDNSYDNNYLYSSGLWSSHTQKMCWWHDKAGGRRNFV